MNYEEVRDQIVKMANLYLEKMGHPLECAALLRVIAEDISSVEEDEVPFLGLSQLLPVSGDFVD
jgi:hypothetical protein